MISNVSTLYSQVLSSSVMNYLFFFYSSVEKQLGKLLSFDLSNFQSSLILTVMEWYCDMLVRLNQYVRREYNETSDSKGNNKLTSVLHSCMHGLIYWHGFSIVSYGVLAMRNLY